MANKTILKWAGSKVRVLDKLLPHLPAGKRLVEPFAGSCAVMMNTDYPAYLVADANADLIDMYQGIKTDSDQFTKSVANCFSCIREKDDFYELRNVFNLRCNFLEDKLYRSSLFLSLNRHCFNGLCRYNAKGEFNVPFGHYKKPYFPMAEIWAFADKSQIATLHHADWRETLDAIVSGDVIYCDPPYLTKDGAFTQYHPSPFTKTEHESLANNLYALNTRLGVPVTVSNSIEAKELYADLGFTVHEIDAPRTIAANGNRKPAKEIIAVLGERP
ncbi:DNA adenine methylase [Xenorhabdus bovienii]|uniref:Site-specific DNA-methyltransferase (adenine-specific) n=1 Tax=Xenorhabdus bovienii str. Intermedium TaxID=1379677 RepID=A0A077QIE7_XENBV|nr:Dam family site-specific DNA-(adenine-N6)-methyltransferase [Xenorhabdus bovienii]CDH33289.1 Retron EC67 DNA adenine methylase [Xenorhabdus bovienii str. Intermedium]